MNAQTALPMKPQASGRGRSRVGLWVGLAVLAMGLVVAVLGLRAAVTTYLDGQAIESYASARSTAAYFVENGRTVGRDMRRLNGFNHADLVTMRQAEDALAAWNASTYNDLIAQLNARSGAQAAVWNSLGKFQQAFDEAAAR